MITSILIANRAEIAIRIIRCCREMGIRSVAVYSVADRNSDYVTMANEAVCIGPASAKDSYLNQDVLIATALAKKVDAIHPGYGFLSENPDFAEAVEKAGLVFIGPTPEHIRLMGDKISAKGAMAQYDIPLVPGSDSLEGDARQAAAIADGIGYPVIIKASRGGGGRGMMIVRSKDTLEGALTKASAEAEAAFGDGTVYLERYLETPRHIEVQVACDVHGNAVYVGERDCSVQRRNQKLVEEARSPALTAEQRDTLGTLCARMMSAIGYRGVGTLEFLYENGTFSFIEMNTRIQVEHPVTEAVYGIDLIREQINIASGGRLSISQADLVPRGHAIECRITAEDPATFAPQPGKITRINWPTGPGVRVDSALVANGTVPPFYDSMIAKIIVHAENRAAAIQRMLRALDETVIEGILTNLPLQQRIISSNGFRSGDINVHWLEEQLLAAT